MFWEIGKIPRWPILPNKLRLGDCAPLLDAACETTGACCAVGKPRCWSALRLFTSRKLTINTNYLSDWGLWNRQTNAITCNNIYINQRYSYMQGKNATKPYFLLAGWPYRPEPKACNWEEAVEFIIWSKAKTVYAWCIWYHNWYNRIHSVESNVFAFTSSYR